MVQKFVEPNKALRPSPVAQLHGEGVHFALHQHYVPNFKAKSKSRAASHNLEFLSNVFASDGASRFFKTFLLRFLFDSNKSSSEDYSALLKPAIA